MTFSSNTGEGNAGRAEQGGVPSVALLYIVSGPVGFPNDDSQEQWLPGQNKTGNVPFTFLAFL